MVTLGTRYGDACRGGSRIFSRGGGGVRELLRESFGEATEGGLEYEVL